MNLENIKINDTFKNYKLLCEMLDEPLKTGKSKQLQLKDWERYFKYSKNGNSFIINEIYDEPEEKLDGRSSGNNSSVISDTIHDFIVNQLEYEFLPVEGSKSGIIRQVGLVDDEFCNCYYNFDEVGFHHAVNGEEVAYTAIEKEFFFDYCDKVMGSYKSRLQRVLDNFGDAINITKYYQTCFLKQGNYGEFYATDTVSDEETIAKINKLKENLEVTYGVTDPSDKWKIFSNRYTSKKFYEDFIGQVKTLLKDESIENCYEILCITRNEDSEQELEYKRGEDSERLNLAQSKFAEDKIKSVFKMTVSTYDGYRGFIKVPKYNIEDISDDTIKDCMEMVNTGIEIDKTTGEAIFRDVVGW